MKLKLSKIILSKSKMTENRPIDFLRVSTCETDSFLEKCNETLRSASKNSGLGKELQTSLGFSKSTQKGADSFCPIIPMDYYQMIAKRRSNRNGNIKL